MWDLFLNSQMKKPSSWDDNKLGPTNNKSQVVQNPDDLFSAMRGLLVFGRLIGVVPLQGVFQPFSENLRFTRRSPPVVYAVLICFSLIICSVLNAMANFKTTSNSPVELAWSANLTIYYGIGSFMYIFMLKRGPNFVKLFQNWRESFALTYDKIDDNLFRDVNILAICLYTSCILEHSFAHFKFFPFVENAERRLLNANDLQSRLRNASAWETYYWRSHPFVGDIIPYHFVVAFTIFICSKYCILAWNFGDILIAVMSRALSYRFKILHEQAKAELVGDGGFVSKDAEKWRQLAGEHSKLRELAQQFDELLSPLTFTLLGVNLFSFCLQLNLGLTPKATTTLIASIYAVWSFSHLLMRILVATIAASNVNVHAHRIEAILKKCPMECYSPQIDRTERAIRGSKIGLTGLGCFTITRPFILQIVNVVFTFEIVLLQTGSTNSTS